jgi:hypothetical protein
MNDKAVSAKETIQNIANSQCGWASSLAYFSAVNVSEVVNSLVEFVATSTPAQIQAWKRSVPPLQNGCKQISRENPTSAAYGAVLEYFLPDSMKRADAILLVCGSVLVVEFKGDGNEEEEYLEQAADYSRRLYWYHQLCGAEGVNVHTLVISYGIRGASKEREWITLANIDELKSVVAKFDNPGKYPPIPVEKFIRPDLCQPSPSLVRAVREYYAKNKLPRIKRIDDITRPAVERVVNEIHATHADKRRKLILLSGVPGAGKTYVGLQIAHEPFLDDLAVGMPGGEKPTAPAVFLSGNRPLVEVLQYEMRQAGGGGRVFVRGVHEFMKRFSSKKSAPPPHHVMIFDEAQRAWDEDQVRYSHKDPSACSEPEAFIRFAGKVPEWSVVMGLIGDGQQISYGEEGGVALWAKAVAQGGGNWDICGPPQFEDYFSREGIPYNPAPELHLSKSVRFHFAMGLSDWAGKVVEDSSNMEELRFTIARLRSQGYQLRCTRRLDAAKNFLWEKYRNQTEARFGLLMSARDKSLLPVCGITAVNVRTFRAGPWYADPETSPNSCRRLTDAITEFSAQGLELDHTLLAWGTDFIRKNGVWDDSFAMKFQRKNAIRNPLQLRRNAYRVLLTRGREGSVICLPHSLKELDETHAFLLECGCEDMDA